MDQRNFQYLFFGLASCWVIMIAYLLVLTQRSGKIRQELERVKRMVDDGDTKPRG